jgi:hypothetical protein
MGLVTLESLTEQLELAEQLHAGRKKMFEPQELPGRYGRVVKALDRLLQAVGCEAAVAGPLFRNSVVSYHKANVEVGLRAVRQFT